MSNLDRSVPPLKPGFGRPMVATLAEVVEQSLEIAALTAEASELKSSADRARLDAELGNLIMAIVCLPNDSGKRADVIRRLAKADAHRLRGASMNFQTLMRTLGEVDLDEMPSDFQIEIQRFNAALNAFVAMGHGL